MAFLMLPVALQCCIHVASFLNLEDKNQLNCVVVAGLGRLLVPLNQKSARSRVYRPFS